MSASKQQTHPELDSNAPKTKQQKSHLEDTKAFGLKSLLFKLNTQTPSPPQAMSIFCQSRTSYLGNPATKSSLQRPHLSQHHIISHNSDSMPSDDYTSTSRGSLKLKGSTPSGIKKKKKKDKSKLSVVAEGGAAADSALQKVLADEDTSTMKGHDDKKGERDEELDETQLRELETRDGDGKTASERQYEEMRRKRVRIPR